MELDVFTVDAFTDRPFCGNPAAVCILKPDNPIDESLMQSIAKEINLSETAFVVLEEKPDGSKDYTSLTLRWFTPTCEVSLCGHATLATSAVLYQALKCKESSIAFTTLSGVLKASRDGDYITLDFPLGSCAPIDQGPLQDLITLTVGNTPIAEVHYSSNRKKLLIRLPDDIGREELEKLQPDIQALPGAPQPNGVDIRGVVVTTRGDGKDYDFFSRYFAPWNGIPEDPVTGSAHTVLADYWGRVLGRKEMVARQCSPRGGDVKMKVEGERVFLSGKAYIVMRGVMVLPA